MSTCPFQFRMPWLLSSGGLPGRDGCLFSGRDRVRPGVNGQWNESLRVGSGDLHSNALTAIRIRLQIS